MTLHTSSSPLLEEVWWPKRPPIYDIERSYDENACEGPFFYEEIPSPPPSYNTNPINFLGYTLASPIGVPAGPLLNSHWTSLASALCYDLITYKTIRSHAHTGHPLPNIVYTDATKPLTPSEETPTVYCTQFPPQTIDNIGITNSFGIPSQDATYLQEDIPRAVAALRENQALVVSVVGTDSGGGFDAFVQDFVDVASFAKEAGAHIVEANFSCPNLSTGEGAIFTDPEAVTSITSALAKALGDTPLIIKVGHYRDHELLRKILVAAAQGGAQAISGINTVQAKATLHDGSPALDKNRPASGICGAPIQSMALDFIRNARAIITEEKLPLKLIGVGGVLHPNHIDLFMQYGADLVQTATGMMWDPLLAMRYHYNHPRRVS